MISAWQALSDELARWRDAGRMVDFWWRDDDAAHPTAPFTRLAALAREAQVPLGLATIPEAAEPALFESVGAGIAVLQHGVDHKNRALVGEKATEFPATEPPVAALERIAVGRAKLQKLAGESLLPVLVPAWNRFPAALVACLPRLGIRGYSTFAPRLSVQPTDGLRQANTHVDLIDWKRGRVFVGEERALGEAIAHLAARRAGTVDPSEPTGWLTHHACHEETIWTFLARLFEKTRALAGVRWVTPASVFLGDSGS